MAHARQTAVASRETAEEFTCDVHIPFFISSSVRQAVNVFDNVPVVASLPNTKIASLDSYGACITAVWRPMKRSANEWALCATTSGCTRVSSRRAPPTPPLIVLVRHLYRPGPLPLVRRHGPELLGVRGHCDDP